MQANVGGVDRVLRVVVGLALLSLFFFGEGNLKWIGLIGIVPIITAFARFCPLYAVMGTSTCSNKDNASS